MRHLYAGFEVTFNQGSFDELQDLVQQPHPKKALRIRYYEECLETSDYGGELGCKSVRCDMKPVEIAKPGKPPRLIGDFGIAAAMRGTAIMEDLKRVMADNPVVYKGFLIIFVKKPNPSVLEHCFTLLRDVPPPYRGVYVYFSDDSCIAFRDKSGKIVRGNMDISSCDSSHTSYLFQAMEYVTPFEHRRHIQRLIRQCKLNVRLQSRDKSQTVILRHKDPILFSGSAITTFINNLANVMIAASIADVDPDVLCQADIIPAAATAGYVVTFEPCDDFHGLQFLKNSPMYDTQGNLRSVLNVGVLLRAIGSCHGDLPGRGPWIDRANTFNRSLLHGMFPRARIPFVENMKLLYGDGEILPVPDLEYKVEDDGLRFDVTDEEFFMRYKLPGAYLDELLQVGSSCGSGWSINTRGSSLILEMDYGLGDL